MKTATRLWFVSFVLFVSALLTFGCNQKPAESKPAEDKPAAQQPAAQPAAQTVKEVTVDEVAQLVDSKGATVVDVNNAQTRESEGVISGAVLLSGYKDFDPSAELPTAKDQKLVFYCGGQQCSAAPKAAEKTAAAGYTQVHVMRAGIKGWKEAGKPTVAAAKQGG
jgi:rhodanese-related sulfurtransferase